MVRSAEVMKTRSGHSFRILAVLGAGGEGIAYRAEDADTREPCTVKLFYEKFSDSDTLKRIEYLVSQQFHTRSPFLCTPIEPIIQGRRVGHYMKYAPGLVLEEFLRQPRCSLQDALVLCAAVVHELSMVHERGISHGDLQSGNIKVYKNGPIWEPYLVDFDNYYCSRTAKPRMKGALLYMAPELRNGTGHLPDIACDLYALGVLLHEIILLRHPAAGHDGDKESLNRAMAGGWLQDSARGEVNWQALGGYPVKTLSADLVRLFRSALGANRKERPPAEVWEDALLGCCNRVHKCPNCGGPDLIDTFKRVCPFCGKAYPDLRLMFGNGTTLVVDKGSALVGRELLGGAERVSHRHAHLYRVGPEAWLESFGRNGTFRWNGSKWKKLRNEQPVLLEDGDWLRFANIEARVEALRN